MSSIVAVMLETLVTDRLRMEPITAADLADLHSLNSDTRAMRFLGGVRTPDDTTGELGRILASDTSAGFGGWAVRLREDGAFLGRCGVKRSLATGEHELLYAYHSSRWGFGYATEAALAMVRRTLLVGAPYVIACAVPANAASIAVMQRIGMTFDRRARLYDEDHVVYVLRR